MSESKTYERIFKRDPKYLSDEELKTFIPDVYQKDIYDIDYNRLMLL